MAAASSGTGSAAADHGQPAAATAAEHGGSATAELTDMEERTPLRELLSDQIGAAGSWDLKVYYNELKDYKYTWGGKEQTGRKLVVILLSLDADQYCLGVARLEVRGKPRGASRPLRDRHGVEVFQCDFVHGRESTVFAHSVPHRHRLA